MHSRDISFKRHRFPPQIIAHAVWLYLRFNLSLREVEEMLLERGIDVYTRQSVAGSLSSDPRSHATCGGGRRAPAIFGIWTKSS
jgi:hypothetical protein